MNFARFFIERFSVSNSTWFRCGRRGLFRMNVAFVCIWWLPSVSDVLGLKRSLEQYSICLRPLRYFLLNTKQIQGFTALHECNINVAMNGITVRNTQMGGTSQFQRNIRMNMKTSIGIIQTTKAIIIANDIRTIFLSCSSRLRWWQDNSCLVFLILLFSVHDMVPYAMANKQMGTMIKITKVAVEYVLCAFTWLNAGAQDCRQIIWFP